MLSVRITSDCIVAGQPHAAGDVVNVSADDAALLLSLNRAEPYTAPPADPPAPAKRTKAQIETELAAAQTTVDQLVKDLAEAEE